MAISSTAPNFFSLDQGVIVASVCSSCQLRATIAAEDVFFWKSARLFRALQQSAVESRRFV
jgi:hypothetical protein